MSAATALPRSGTASQVRHALALLAHASSPAKRIGSAITLLVAGFSGWVILDGGGPDDDWLGLCLAALAVGSVWAFWLSHLALLQAEARASRLPGTGRATAIALALGVLVTVLLPALALAGTGLGVWPALAGVSIAAAGGVVLATVPRIYYLAVSMLPLVFVLADVIMVKLAPVTGPLPRPELPGAGWLLPCALLLAAWRWREIAHGGGQHPSPWRRPVMMGEASASDHWGLFSGGKANAHLPDLFWPAGKAHGAGPSRPARAVRAVLGTPFAPLSPGQLLAQALFMAAAYSLLLVGPDATHLVVLAPMMIAVAGVFVLMYGSRLHTLFSRRSMELDELALLPGLGTSADQRRITLAALARASLLLVVPYAAVMMAVVVLDPPGMPGLLLLAMATAGVAMLAALACVRPFAGLAMGGAQIFLLVVPGLLLAMFTAFAAVRESGPRAVDYWVLLPLWALAFGTLLALLASALRRLRVRSHPFLPY